VGDKPDELVDRAPIAAPVRNTLFKDIASETDTVVHRREAALALLFETVTERSYVLGSTKATAIGDERLGALDDWLASSRIHSIQSEDAQSLLGGKGSASQHYVL